MTYFLINKYRCWIEFLKETINLQVASCYARGVSMVKRRIAILSNHITLCSYAKLLTLRLFHKRGLILTSLLGANL